MHHEHITQFCKKGAQRCLLHNHRLSKRLRQADPLPTQQCFVFFQILSTYCWADMSSLVDLPEPTYGSTAIASGMYCLC